MRKIAIVFVLAVFAPSFVLAVLAVRSLRDQQALLERQQSRLWQTAAENLARGANDRIAELQREFAIAADEFRSGGKRDPAEFDTFLLTRWPVAQVGFVVSNDNRILSPQTGGRPEAQQFLLENARFLCNREAAPVYNVALNKQQVLEQQQQQVRAPSEQTSALGQQAFAGKRSVKPQREETDDSKIAWAETEFRTLSRAATDGSVARFLQNKLHILFWHRSTSERGNIYGALLDLGAVTGRLQEVVTRVAKEPDVCAALLNDSARPVALSKPGFSANWKSPFVATEIGEALPHWEIAIYLVDPKKLSRSARTLQWTLGLIIAVLTLAIAVGGWLVFRELRRELTLARQKTDFVSNVSHELKTPLTSIRMFSELLLDGRVPEAKRGRYLSIISAEAARLTRLINNVLDFARTERGERKFQRARCDLGEIVREGLDIYRPHLETGGFHVESELPPEPLPIEGDADALSQVLVNLLSNAEKYSNGAREIRVEARRVQEQLEVRVLDRGPGVPVTCATKIFDKFFRADDALSSGVQGAGLGLTLARQIARAHGGELFYEPRPGGGSCFVLRLPAAAP